MNDIRTLQDTINEENSGHLSTTGEVNAPAVNRGQSRAVYPGAVAVAGPDATSSNDDEFTTTAPLCSVGSLVPVTARLVQGSEEDVEVLQEDVEVLQEQLRQRDEELQAVLAGIENAAVAQVIYAGDEEAQDTNNKKVSASLGADTRCCGRECISCLKSISVDCDTRMKWIVAGIILMLVIVGIVLGVAINIPQTSPDSKPSPSPTDSTPTPPVEIPQDLIDLLSPISFDDGDALETPFSPQNKAAIWLAGNDNLNSYSHHKKIQRYVLATLYYSTNGDEWDTNVGWLSDGDECDWWKDTTQPIYDRDSCSSGGAVVNLILYRNSLDGTIPEEIALLSDSLGEFSMLRCYKCFRFRAKRECLIPLSRTHSSALLILYENSLTATLPSVIGLITNLGKFHYSVWHNH